MDRSDDRKSVGKAALETEVASIVSIEDGILYAPPDSRKIGVAGAVVLILNKMIGTGSESTL